MESPNGYVTDVKVTITSEGTPGLIVNLDTDVLGLSGEMTVTWNGKEAYRGPVK